jgi:hypothetical protein
MDPGRLIYNVAISGSFPTLRAACTAPPSIRDDAQYSKAVNCLDAGARNWATIGRARSIKGLDIISKTQRAVFNLASTPSTSIQVRDSARGRQNLTWAPLPVDQR